MFEEYLSKKESNVYGLKYIPSIEPGLSDESDFIPGTLESISVGKDSGNGQFSQNNGEKLLEEFLKIKDSAKCIVEIGVATKFEKSSTCIFLVNKADSTHYFGIDIFPDNKKHHEDFKPNTHIVGLNSKGDKNEILEILKQNDCEEIDVLFIDGDHSISMMINDWTYAELVKPGGLILIHDTNVHPGPHLIYDAIDEKMFDKKKYFYEEGNDWGLVVAWKK